MSVKKIFFASIMGIAFLLACFLIVDHEKIWGGVLSDAMTQQEQARAAETFDFYNYYGYDAAFSDLSKIFTGKDEAFVDKVLVRQKAYKGKYGPLPKIKDGFPQKDHFFYNGYNFKSLYHCYFGCAPQVVDGIDITFKQNYFFSISMTQYGFMSSYHIQKKAKNVNLGEK